jgi:hypothetical protein
MSSSNDNHVSSSNDHFFSNNNHFTSTSSDEEILEDMDEDNMAIFHYLAIACDSNASNKVANTPSTR